MLTLTSMLWFHQQDKKRLILGGPIAGLVDKLVLSRAGAFSCPVACGVVLLGKIDLTTLDGLPHDEVQQILQVASTAARPWQDTRGLIRQPR